MCTFARSFSITDHDETPATEEENGGVVVQPSAVHRRVDEAHAAFQCKTKAKELGVKPPKLSWSVKAPWATAALNKLVELFEKHGRIGGPTTAHIAPRRSHVEGALQRPPL